MEISQPYLEQKLQAAARGTQVGLDDRRHPASQALQHLGKPRQGHLAQAVQVVPAQRYSSVFWTQPASLALGTDLRVCIGPAHIPVADPPVKAVERPYPAACAARPAVIDHLDRFRIAVQERLPRRCRHLVPRRCRRVEPIAPRQGLYLIVATVERLAEIPLGKESWRIHGAATQRLLRMDDQLVGIGFSQRTDAVARATGSGIMGRAEMPRLGDRCCRCAVRADPRLPRSMHHHPTRQAAPLTGPRQQRRQVVCDLGDRPYRGASCPHPVSRRDGDHHAKAAH